MLGKIGQLCFENPKRVLLGWLLVAVSIFGVTAYIGSAYDGSFEIPESDSRDGFIVLDEHFGGTGSGYRGSMASTNSLLCFSKCLCCYLSYCVPFCI